MDIRLDGKAALVAGAARGIGARSALFADSNQAEFLTGVGLPIDGGMHIG